MTLSFNAPPWTSALDQPRRYEIRYLAKAPLDDASFGNGIPSDMPPAPGTPGQAQTATVAGLKAETQYYVGVRAINACGAAVGRRRSPRRRRRSRSSSCCTAASSPPPPSAARWPGARRCCARLRDRGAPDHAARAARRRRLLRDVAAAGARHRQRRAAARRRPHACSRPPSPLRARGFCPNIAHDESCRGRVPARRRCGGLCAGQAVRARVPQHAPDAPDRGGVGRSLPRPLAELARRLRAAASAPPAAAAAATDEPRRAPPPPPLRRHRRPAVDGERRRRHGHDHAARQLLARPQHARACSRAIDIAKQLPTGTQISAHYLLDAITSASIAAGVLRDQPFTELRNEAGFSLGQVIGPVAHAGLLLVLVGERLLGALRVARRARRPLR